MEKTQETYSITVDIRDENHKLIMHPTKENHPLARGLRFDFVVDEEKCYEQLEMKMRDFHKELQAFLPTRKINLEAAVSNSISGTWMVMASFYGSENRFVKH
jgi:hypothetical protein